MHCKRLRFHVHKTSLVIYFFVYLSIVISQRQEVIDGLLRRKDAEATMEGGNF